MDWIRIIQFITIIINLSSGIFNLVMYKRSKKINDGIFNSIKILREKMEEDADEINQAKIKFLNYCTKCGALIKLKQ